MDIISKEWLLETSDLADRYERGEIKLSSFTNDQLVYLIYWNWGYSGPDTVRESKDSEAELIRRNSPYNNDYAAELIERTEEFY